MRLEEAVAALAALLVLPFVFVADRAGRDFFVPAEALADRLALAGAFARPEEAVVTPAASATAAVPFRSEADGRGAAVVDV